MKYKIALLYICTGKYDVFWKEFYDSYEKNFLHNSIKEYFVFTDAEQLYKEENEHVHKIYQNVLGWPKDTLMRYHMFDSIHEQLKTYDYIFFMNANMQCMRVVTEKEFLPVDDKNILVVQHPGFYNKKVEQFDYDRNRKSKAFIPFGKGNVYVCGGVNGGKAEEFLTMTSAIKKMVDEDMKVKQIALWHDESYLNKYILNRNDYKLLSPAFCSPEGWNIPFEAVLLVREKGRYINVENVKGRKSKFYIKLFCRQVKYCFMKIGAKIQNEK